MSSLFSACQHKYSAYHWKQESLTDIPFWGLKDAPEIPGRVPFAVPASLSFDSGEILFSTESRAIPMINYDSGYSVE